MKAIKELGLHEIKDELLKSVSDDDIEAFIWNQKYIEWDIEHMEFDIDSNRFWRGE
jgi:hypothetical protein